MNQSWRPLVLTLGICLVALTAAAADGPAGTAAPPPAPDLELALDVEPEPNVSTATGRCDRPLEAVLFASGGERYPATCTADCGPYTDVSCSTSGTCTAVDRNCAAGERGYVTCSGNTTFCPVCPTPCNEGSFRFIKTGNCCDCGLGERIREKCVNGEWVFDGTVCFPDSNLCPWCP